MPNYSKAYLNQMVQEFTAEFEALVNAEVKKSETSAGNPLNKSEEGDSDSKEKSSSGGESEGGSESSGGSDGPPKGPPGGGDDASAGGPPAADPASASAGGPPADPASAGGVPPADPAAGAAGGDPVQALVQAYGQLSPEELQAHFFALKQVLDAQMGAGAGGADPMAGGAPAPAGAGGPPAPGGADPTMAPPGPDAAAPMAGEGSKPVDPAATMALKSEYEKQLSLLKKERDEALTKSQQLEKSLTGLTDQLEKFVAKPERKAVTGKDLLKSEPQTQTVTLTREQILKKLTVVARNPDLKKSDRDAINKYCVGGVSADSIAHLLSEQK